MNVSMDDLLKIIGGQHVELGLLRQLCAEQQKKLAELTPKPEEPKDTE